MILSYCIVQVWFELCLFSEATLSSMARHGRLSVYATVLSFLSMFLEPFTWSQPCEINSYCGQGLSRHIKHPKLGILGQAR